MKRMLALLLSVALLLALLPAGMVAASSRPLTLQELQKMYPHGAYWNHTGTTDNPLGYTWTPCYHHTGNCTYSGSCGCNSYQGKAIQCMGFAYQLASLAYDCDPRSEWSTNYSTSALDKLKAGDILRYRNGSHSIFITAVDGDVVTYADGNGDNRCQIQWGKTTTKATLKSSFTYVKTAPYALEELHAPEAEEPTLTIRYHAGGGTISASVEAHQYMVTDPDGLNMRSGAGTGNAILTALPIGTVFAVKVGDTKKANGYTWGKTTFNGVTGWVVISDFVTKTTDLSEGDYYLMDSVVYSVKTAAPITQTATVGDYVKLSNPATFNLTNGKRPFLGWTAYPEDGEPLYSWDVAKLKAEVLCPTLTQQSETLTLYAVWGCAHEYAASCAEKCSKCGEQRAVVHKFKDKTCTVCGKVQTELAILTQPQNATAPEGEKVTVTMVVVGDDLTYTWYIKNAGKTKFSKSSVSKSAYTTAMSEAAHGRQIYCVITDAYGDTVQTDTVTLYRSTTIVTQPQNVVAAYGTIAKTEVAALGDGLTYAWYIQNAGKTKFSKSSVKKATYATAMSEAAHGRQIYCVITDATGNTAQTDTVTLSCGAYIVTQPQNAIAPEGEKATVTAEAIGDGLTYTWYVKNAGKTKFSKSSITKATYSVAMSEAVHGRQIYCVITDATGNTVQTDTVTLYRAVTILTQPQNGVAAYGTVAKTEVEVMGDGLTYTWYVKNAGKTKFSLSSIKKATYTTTMSEAVHGRQIYCVITDAYGNTVQTDTVTLSCTAHIVTQPQNATAPEGEKATVTAEVIGDGLTYTWYVKNAGATKFSKSSITKATYAVVMSDAVHGRQIYCVITDATGNTVQTKTVTLRRK